MVVPRGVYAIYDHPHPGGLSPAAAVGAILAGGARVVQLRAKAARPADRLRLVAVLGPLCARSGAALWVDDDVEAALSGPPGVVGVHLGQGDLAAVGPGFRARLRDAGLFLGVSTHTLAQLRDARSFQPAYVAFGPVFATRSKIDPEPVVGLSGLARAVAESCAPVVAIGGIDAAGAPECLRCGAVAVAVIAAIAGPDAEQIAARTRSLVSACGSAGSPGGPGAIDHCGANEGG